MAKKKVAKDNNKFILFDYNNELVTQLEQAFSSLPNFTTICVDVRKFVKEQTLDYIVSPANSLGFMDGGIDDYYRKIFPDIQRTVQTAIRKYNIKHGYHYSLPIGSAIIVPTGHPTCSNMIIAPTMVIPEDIRGTTNVYESFIGILMLTKHMKNKVIAIPGLGTCTGKIPFNESASEMRRAYDNFANNSYDIGDKQIIKNNELEYVVVTL